ncbi:outer membrane beta-barrel protein [Azospirillum sp. 11R-A]|uniref:outer membrane beta-barrel protein n=1 Tax=Azospirillum sp. 11R-A TaxID=3111634 RepID=UPI003C1FE833
MYAGTIYKDYRQIALALAALGTVSSASLAFAQTLNVQQEEDPRRVNNAARITKEVSPRDSGADDKERVQASYQPKGVELGSFILFPAIENEVLFNSNIYSTRDNVKADIVDKVMPEIKLRSRFSEHAVNFTARAEQFLYRTHDAENHLDANIMADGRYDLSRDWEANGLLSFNRSYEDRGSPDAVAGEHPTLTNTYSTRLGSKQRSGRMTYAAVLTLDRRLYGDVSTSTGTAINNSDRNRIESEGTVSASYELFPGYAAVAELSANRRRYDDRRDDLGFERSSWGYAARTGVSVDLSQLVRGDFTVGYMAQDYEDSRFTDPHGLSVRASFNWTPSKLTVVVPSLERSIQETTASQTSALVRTSAGLLVRHELERNIVLTASGKVFNDYYEGTRQSNWTYEARLRGIWALAPEYYVGAETGTRVRTSTVKSSEFTQTVMLLRLGAHL